MFRCININLTSPTQQAHNKKSGMNETYNKAYNKAYNKNEVMNEDINNDNNTIGCYNEEEIMRGREFI